MNLRPSLLLLLVIGHIIPTEPAAAQEPLQGLRDAVAGAEARFVETRYNLEPIEALGGTLYRFERVSAVIDAVRESVIGAVRQLELGALEDHTSEYFDSAGRMLERRSAENCDRCVTKTSTDRTYEFISRENQFLMELEALLVDLETVSDQEGTHVSLFRRNERDSSYDEYTDGVIENVAVGTYLGAATLEGFKSASFRLDLVRQSGTQIRCSMIVAGTAGQSVCRHRQSRQ